MSPAHLRHVCRIGVSVEFLLNDGGRQRETVNSVPVPGTPFPILIRGTLFDGSFDHIASSGEIRIARGG